MVTPMAKVFFFLKFFEKEQYARDFIEGRLYLNPLKYFKRLELGDDGRGDPYEAPTFWHQPKDVEALSIDVGDAELEIRPLSEVVVQENQYDSHNILCLYAAFRPEAARTYEEYRNSVLIPERCLRMGPVAVLIDNVREFRDRIASAVKGTGFHVQLHPVEYFDGSTYSARHDKPIFAKEQKYSWQREYRLAVDRHVAIPEPYILDVGPIGDICRPVDPGGLNDTIQIE